MRSFNLIRSLCCTGLAIGLLAGAAISSAQEVTTEPTQDMMMMQMMSMSGACPQDAAANMLASMLGTSAATPMMGATEDMNMQMTPAATMDMTMTMPTPMVGATEEAGGVTASGTEEAMGVKCLFGQFSGSAEVPGPGAPAARGFVFVSVDPASGNICYEEAISDITLPATATHIHVNSAGLSGDIVVPFPVAPDVNGMASGCTTTTVAGLAQAIVTNPEQYYVNVHTSDFPKGAARAQLSAWDSSMMNNIDMSTTPGMSTPMSPASTESASG
jgi:hypothetical protein